MSTAYSFYIPTPSPSSVQPRSNLKVLPGGFWRFKAFVLSITCAFSMWVGGLSLSTTAQILIFQSGRNLETDLSNDTS